MSHELYFGHQRAVQAVHDIVISYRIAPIGPRVDAVRSELDEHVFAWLLEHVDLRAARPRPGARRGNPAGIASLAFGILLRLAGLAAPLSPALPSSSSAPACRTRRSRSCSGSR